MNLFCGVGRQQRRCSGLLVNNDLHSLYLHGLTNHLRRIPSKDGYLNNINLLNSRSQSLPNSRREKIKIFQLGT